MNIAELESHIAKRAEGYGDACAGWPLYECMGDAYTEGWFAWHLKHGSPNILTEYRLSKIPTPDTEKG